MSDRDSERSSSGGEEEVGDYQELQKEVKRTTDRVKGLKETVSHLQSMYESATHYAAEQDKEIEEKKKELAELEPLEGKRKQDGGVGGKGDAVVEVNEDEEKEGGRESEPEPQAEGVEENTKKRARVD